MMVMISSDQTSMWLCVTQLGSHDTGIQESLLPPLMCPIVSHCFSSLQHATHTHTKPDACIITCIDTQTVESQLKRLAQNHPVFVTVPPVTLRWIHRPQPVFRYSEKLWSKARFLKSSLALDRKWSPCSDTIFCFCSSTVNVLLWRTEHST